MTSIQATPGGQLLVDNWFQGFKQIGKWIQESELLLSVSKCFTHTWSRLSTVCLPHVLVQCGSEGDTLVLRLPSLPCKTGPSCAEMKLSLAELIQDVICPKFSCEPSAHMLGMMSGSEFLSV